MEKRNINLDVIRCVALLYILCVHFFMQAGYYSTVIAGPALYLGTILRNTFTACVPLFIILTGYLMNKKTISKKYYMGISKVLILYGLSCIPIWIFRAAYLGETFTVGTMLKSLVTYELYAWYVALYVGLYLLIPFLNLIYNNLADRKQKTLLLLILVFLTALPSITNIFGFNLIPVFWEEIYPITYYFIGAYLCEYKDEIKLSTIATLVLYLLVLLVGGTFVYFFVQNRFFYDVGLFVDWGNILNTTSSTLLFLFLLKCDFSRLPKPICKAVETISLVSLQLYLVSWIFDTVVYFRFNMKYAYFSDKLLLFPIPIAMVFICSFILAIIIHFVYKGIKKISAQK